MIKLSTLIGILLLLPTVWADGVKTDKATETRAKYAKESSDALKIAEPIRVTAVHQFKDGGTIGIELTDAKDRKHEFCLDGRSLEDANRKGTRNLFVGAVYPTRPGARNVEVRGPEESAFYGVMLRWANKHPQREALYNEKIVLNTKEFGDLWEVRTFFLKLDARFVQK
jgi:hypothetical protein